ncbi:MAG: hypothetical protein R3362_10005, partial [Rhodothermales bacterium]|nr:hypothetical protein [Rhodothermales bacterium]
KPRVNQNRVDEAAETTSATVVGTACPFCSVMMRDGINETGRQERLQTREIAQLVADALPANGHAADSEPAASAPPTPNA